MKGYRLVAGMSVMVVAGCAGISPVQVGQTAGTIAGAAAAPGIGAPVGALVGLLAGMVVQGQMDKVTERREQKELSAELGTPSTATSQDSDAPPIGQPARVWVDEAVHEGRLVAGHFDTRYIP